jgi:hypothetical protein
MTLTRSCGESSLERPIVLIPQRSQAPGRPKPKAHMRSDPSTATDQGSAPGGSWEAPATVPSGRISVTVLEK